MKKHQHRVKHLWRENFINRFAWQRADWIQKSFKSNWTRSFGWWRKCWTTTSEISKEMEKSSSRMSIFCSISKVFIRKINRKSIKIIKIIHLMKNFNVKTMFRMKNPKQWSVQHRLLKANIDYFLEKIIQILIEKILNSLKNLKKVFLIFNFIFKKTDSSRFLSFI